MTSVSLFPRFLASRETRNFQKIFQESRKISGKFRKIREDLRDFKNPRDFWDSEIPGKFFRETFPSLIALPFFSGFQISLLVLCYVQGWESIPKKIKK